MFSQEKKVIGELKDVFINLIGGILSQGTYLKSSFIE